MKVRVIDALQMPEVLAGKKWMALPLPGSVILPTMTIGVDPARMRMYWCDQIYNSRAVCPSHFGAEATLMLPQLLGECTLIDAVDGPEWTPTSARSAAP